MFPNRAASWRWLICTLPVWIVALGLGGCTSPRPDPTPFDPRGPRAHGAPDWAGLPNDWAKLERIESWLATDAYRYDVYWQVQGELDLCEGRLEFAAADDGTPAAASESWKLRVHAARSGFERVIATSGASTEQRERARLGLARLDRLAGAAAVPEGPYLSRAAWRARKPISSRLTPAGGPYTRITIHHTADVPGARFDGTMADSLAALHNIQRNHMDNRRYGDIGYHFLIDPAGRVFIGRSLAYQGAHAGGENNRQNLGICLLGNFEKARPSASSLAALDALLADLRGSHRIERTRIVGHGELKSTLCPGASLLAWTKEYRRSGPSLASLSGGAPRPAAAPPSDRGTRTATARKTGGGSATVR